MQYGDEYVLSIEMLREQFTLMAHLPQSQILFERMDVTWLQKFRRIFYPRRDSPDRFPLLKSFETYIAGASCLVG